MKGVNNVDISSHYNGALLTAQVTHVILFPFYLQKNVLNHAAVACITIFSTIKLFFYMRKL